MSTITLRPLQPADSIDELTAMLRRAFARLGASGLNCTCVNQTPPVTRERIGRGECLLALSGSRILGTVTLQTAAPQAEIAWYRQPDVASLHQLAVEPCHQGKGIGEALLRAAERWALAHGCLALALDTPETASHLRTYYAHQGFRERSTVQLAGRTYRSVVLSKAAWQAACMRKHDAWPPRHPAEMALLAKPM